jgi:aconitate hydratase
VPADEGRRTQLERGPNIKPLPIHAPIPDALAAPVMLALGDDVSTDEIMPAGTRALPYYSNIDELARFAFDVIDPTYAQRANGDHVIVAGRNYGQGSSREHAALVPRHLGLRVVIAIQYARIHVQNLLNFGVLPLTFVDPADRDRISVGDVLAIAQLHAALRDPAPITVENRTKGITIRCAHELSPRQLEMLLAGGVIPLIRQRRP